MLWPVWVIQKVLTKWLKCLLEKKPATTFCWIHLNLTPPPLLLLCVEVLGAKTANFLAHGLSRSSQVHLVVLFKAHRQGARAQNSNFLASYIISFHHLILYLLSQKSNVFVLDFVRVLVFLSFGLNESAHLHRESITSWLLDLLTTLYCEQFYCICSPQIHRCPFFAGRIMIQIRKI